jgi:hypothetical protein
MLPPRFCPRCKREAPENPAIDRCPECREVLLPQGYCPICEKRLKLAVGQSCPKHDTTLATGPENDDANAATDDSNWVTLATYGDDTRAEAHRLRLEGEGIPTLLDNGRMGSRSMLQVATGGMQLKVPEVYFADARVILSQIWSDPTANDQYEPDDDWEGLVPEPYERRRQVMKNVAILLLAPSIIGFVLALVIGVVGLFFLLIRLLGW